MDGRQQRQTRARYKFKDIHDVLFPTASPDARSILDYDEGIRDLMRCKHARLDPTIPVKRVC